MAARFEAHDLVGAVVTVVEIGKPTVSRGSGYADLASLTPVDAERTLFRIGSVTKLFVWTAVMHLVEQGLLDLHAGVNDYLATVRVSDTFTGWLDECDRERHGALHERAPPGRIVR